MNNILIDNIIFFLQSHGGISVYWYELLKNFETKASYNITLTYDPKDSNNCYKNNLKRYPTNIVAAPGYLSRYLDYKNDNSDITHSSYYRLPAYSQRKKTKIITTVHDFTYEYYRKGLPLYIHSLQKNRAIKNSDGIICISNNTKNDLLKFNPDVSPDSIKVIYNGISSEFYKLDSLDIEIIPNEIAFAINGKYALFVGSRFGYKNFKIAVDAIAEKNDIKLVICGPPLNSAEVRMLNSKLGESGYSYFQNITNDVLNILYNFAWVFIYPSSYEGFGIPVIESMAAGCPVVACDTSSISEISNNSALLASKTSSEEICNLIEKLEDEIFKKQIIKQGISNAKKFTWDKCAEETSKYYEYILNNRC